MASRRADEERNRKSGESLRRAAEEGPVQGKDASERAATMASDADAPLAPGETGGGTPGVHAVPPVIPAGAMANMSVDSTSGATGAQGGPQGVPAAAALIAGEIAFGQDDVKTGWDVLAADDAKIGTVTEVGPERLLVNRIDREGMVYVPYAAVASVDKRQVHLSVPSGLVDQQDWQQVRPGGPSGGTSPPPSEPATRVTPGDPGSSSSDEFAASHAVEPERAEHAGPVTTGRGVEEGPTHQTIRAEPAGAPGPAPRPDSTRRPVGQPMPPQFGEETEMGPMQKAQDVMSSVKSTVQGAAQGQMSQSSAPRDALADMFSFLENIPNSFYYLATVVSMMTSLVLFVSGKRWESLFVGLWAPTIVSASMFYKLLRPSHEVRQM